LFEASKDNLPKFAIANGWAFGTIPAAIKNLSQAEIRMVTKASTTAVIHLVGRSNGRGVLRTHTMTWKAEPKPAALMLPRELDNQDFMVVFSGATEADKQQAKDRYLKVRRECIQAAIDFLLKKSAAYQGLRKNIQAIADMTDDTILNDLVSDEGIDGNIINDALNDAERVEHANNAETTSGLFNLLPPEIRNMSVQNIASTGHSANSCRVIHSNQILNENDQFFYSSAFPELFPYGIGTPNDDRRVKVSVEAGLGHLLRIHDRRFAQHPYFTLVAFDIIAKRQGKNRLVLNLKYSPSIALNSISVTSEQMHNVIKHQHENRKSIRSGRGPIPLPEAFSEGALKMLKSVENCGSHTFGTKEERMQMGKKINAYCQVRITFPIYFILLHHTNYNSKFHTSTSAGRI
jgi:hypothetical protein